uniref:Uncharacterized protein n=1 Tax=Chrysotila carterae TaxID=13221 RepID=A0A7S4FAQ3_CHRCT|mmetsp:Transcript_33008/g.72537  ORF Transcript_33008/g.72537 Transcript_33008/m.72537 type:complete len:169 (-) Transcript_33008:294-800(-)|eukprot:6212165-Pleurochrysis_carterae.AAC.3
MVEFVLIRLADLRDEAEAEQWQQRHPCRAALAKRLRYVYVRSKLMLKWARGTAAAAAISHAMLQGQATASYIAVACILTLSRWARQSPPRVVADTMGVKALRAEIEKRGLRSDACIDRADLIDVLCGPSDRSCTTSFTGRLVSNLLAYVIFQRGVRAQHDVRTYSGAV